MSAASYGSPIAPGELISIFGASFVPGSTSVTVKGVSAQVLGATATQVNAIVPASLPTQDPNLLGAAVVVTTPAGSSPAEVAALAGTSPALFTADGSGCGQAAALNIRPDGTTSVNSPTNSAAPGDYLAVFGTGFGMWQTPPLLFLDNSEIPSLSYAGTAPGLTGVDQVNFQIPSSTRTGCAVSLQASQAWVSPSVTVAVQKGGGKCSDPPIQSYGTISMNKSFNPGFPNATSENFFAQFPAGPALQPPPPETVVRAPNWSSREGIIVIPTLDTVSGSAPILRSCTIPGYANLSAGPILIQPAPGVPSTITPLPISQGVAYSSSLPSGFIVPGRYTIASAPGNAVYFNTTMSIGSPIQVTTAFAPATKISQSQPLTVQWTGGDPGAFVRVGLSASSGNASYTSYSYADASAGSLTMQPTCVGGVCSFGLPNPVEGITVTVLPATPQTIHVSGITGPVQLNWSYSYNYSVGFGN